MAPSPTWSEKKGIAKLRGPAASSAAPRLPPTAAKLADLWLAADKLQHLVFCGTVVLVVYAVARKVLPQAGHGASLAASVLTSLVLGALKELGDHLKWWPGNLSYKDFTADLAGIALAAAAITAYHHQHQHLTPSSSSSAPALLSGSAASRRPGYRAVPSDIEMGGGHLPSVAEEEEWHARC